jgi:hypothetical protein
MDTSADMPPAAGERALGLRASRFWAALILFLAAGMAGAIQAQTRFGLPPRWRQIVAVLVAAGLLSMPEVRGRIAWAFGQPRHLDRSRRYATAVAIAVICGIYLYATAALQERAFIPLWHDEQQFLIQTQMLAGGRLWMPAHELADFFDTFYVLVRPVYAAQSFPGAALMNVPAVWLDLPTWLMPLLIASATAAVFYLVLAELLGDFYAGLGVLLLLGVSRYRMLALIITGHLPVVLLGLLVILAYFRWRRTRGWAAALAMGLCAGWAAITRPVDALCFILPVGVAMLADLRTSRWRMRLLTAALVILSAAPFGALQLIFNKGVTGSWFQTPFDYYNRLDLPALGLGGAKADLSARPRSPLSQKQQLYSEMFLPMIAAHRHWGREFMFQRLPMILSFGLPTGVLAVAFATGILALSRTRYWILWSSGALFAALYCLYPVFLVHYVIVASPALIFGALLGCKVLIDRWPDSPALQAVAPSILALCALLSLPELSWVRDHSMDAPLLTALPGIEQRIDPPAVILFRYGPNSSPHEEPVYNWGVAWPDDAPIIHAHDLGPRNGEVIRYYATHQPQRTFYLMDRDSGRLKPLGTARELANMLEEPKAPPH